MAWNFPRLTQRAFPQATGLGGMGLGLLRPSVLPGRATIVLTDGVDAFGETICNFRSFPLTIRYKTGTHVGVTQIPKRAGNPYPIFNRGKLRAAKRACVR